jgi:hypothetical protein|tara:strand:+ start:40 stop:246 length:207 start_codon:yes stop_codon:yes gene_type:complete
MKKQIIDNLRAKYQNQIAIARTNVELFIASPQGVAEHIDFSETVEKELEKIAHANDMLEALEYVSSDV